MFFLSMRFPTLSVVPDYVIAQLSVHPYAELVIVIGVVVNLKSTGCKGSVEGTHSSWSGVFVQFTCSYSNSHESEI